MRQGLGLADFFRNAMAGSNAGQQAMQNSVAMGLQHRWGLQQAGTQRDNQLADQRTSRQQQVEDQKKAELQHESDQDLAAAEHGFQRVRGGEQAGARRIVEAPQRVRDNPALAAVDSGLVGVPGAAGAITAMELGAAMNDPRNAPAQARAGNPLESSGWENLRGTAMNGGADTWEMNPQLFAATHPQKPGKAVGLTPELMDRYRLRAAAASKGGPDPSQLEMMIAAALGDGNDDLAKSLTKQRAEVQAAAQGTFDDQMQQHLLNFIQQDIKAGVPEAGLLQQALASGAFGPAQPGAGGSPHINMEEEANAPPGAAVSDADLASHEAALTQALAKRTANPAAPPPVNQDSLYPTNYLTQQLLQRENRINSVLQPQVGGIDPNSPIRILGPTPQAPMPSQHQAVSSQVNQMFNALSGVLGSAPAQAQPPPGQGHDPFNQMNAILGGARQEAMRNNPRGLQHNSPPYKIVNGQLVPKQPGEPGYNPNYRPGGWPY